MFFIYLKDIKKHYKTMNDKSEFNKNLLIKWQLKKLYI
jgi:hypothetical protein